MDLTITLSEPASRNLEAITHGDRASATTIATALLEQALGTVSREELIQALLTQARHRAATEPLDDEEWGRRFDQVRTAILQDAIEKGTAIEGDFLDE